MFFLPSVVFVSIVVVLCVVVVVGVVCGETPVTTIQQWLRQRLSENQLLYAFYVKPADYGMK
jgi:hypothetical protein